MSKPRTPKVQPLDPASVEYLGRHVILRRMLGRGRRCKIENTLPIAKLQQIASDLLASGFEAAGYVAEKYDLIPKVTSDTAFYRWRTRLFELALEIHREMVSDRALPQLARLDEVGNALRLSDAKLRSMIEAGELPTVEIAPGEQRIPKAAVRDLIVARTPKRDAKGRFRKSE